MKTAFGLFQHDRAEQEWYIPQGAAGSFYYVWNDKTKECSFCLINIQRHRKNENVLFNTMYGLFDKQAVFNPMKLLYKINDYTGMMKDEPCFDGLAQKPRRERKRVFSHFLYFRFYMKYTCRCFAFGGAISSLISSFMCEMADADRQNKGKTQKSLWFCP